MLPHLTGARAIDPHYDVGAVHWADERLTAASWMRREGLSSRGL